MSGHSKWKKIKGKKGIADNNRGKIFTKHARLIALAAKNGADVNMNPTLRAAIELAKADNTPNENIERAIKKGAGLDKGGVVPDEVMYEGFGPNGVALLIHAITDNRNRTVSSLRETMTKNGGNLGESGSVSWMFERKGYFLIDCTGRNLDDAELQIIELGADDIQRDEGNLEVYSETAHFFTLKNALIKAGFKIEDSGLHFVPKQSVNLENADRLYNLIEKIEDDDDVIEVFSNATA